MRLLFIIGIGLGLVPAGRAQAPDTTTFAVARVVDGKGGVVSDAAVVISGGKILRIDRRPAGKSAIALPTATLLPGLIDVHVHPTSYERDSRLRGPGDGDAPDVATAAAVDNLNRTLAAGFTTVQSIGAAQDRELQALIAGGTLPGPRLITSLNPIMNPALTPDSLRALVRQRAAAGAQAIKLFASRGLGEGGAPTMSQEQLDALCGEARARGLRTLVHAHSSESIRRAVMAGCSQIEHGVFVTQDVIDLMARRGTYFDPQCSAVFQNYLDHRLTWFAGGSYATDEGKALLEKGLSLGAATTKAAAGTPGLKLVYGTDAVAVGNGRNADDLYCRVQRGGQTPMDVIVAATSRNAESLGLGGEIGSITPGMTADLLVVAGNPLDDIKALGNVLLVVRGGRIVVDHRGGAK